MISVSNLNFEVIDNLYEQKQLNFQVAIKNFEFYPYYDSYHTIFKDVLTTRLTINSISLIILIYIWNSNYGQ